MLMLKIGYIGVSHAGRWVHLPALVGTGNEKVVAGGIVRSVPNLLKIKPKACSVCAGAVLSWPREDRQRLPEHLASDSCGGGQWEDDNKTENAY